MGPSELDDKDSLIRQLCAARSELTAMKAKQQDLKKNVQNSLQILYEEMVGRDFVQAMLQSRGIAERYIEHPDAKYRSVAIGIITNHWKPDEQFAAICERLAFTDDHVSVRSAAITALGVWYESAGNRRMGRILAQMVVDASHPEILRKSAYEALWQLARGGDSLYASMLSSPATIQFPDNVDWPLVSQFLSE